MKAKTLFWGAAALLVHTHVTYPLTLAALERLRGRREGALPVPGFVPSVSLVIAAHDEEDVIAAKIANATALDYPRERLELIVASDGSADRTVAAAREAGADLVLDLPRGGKIAAQNAAVERARGDIVAFSDANAFWRADALRELVAPFYEDDVGYVCGQVHFLDAAGDNEEGAYWRYEMWVRSLESGQAGVTAGNGGIYAVRRDLYEPLQPSRSHDLNLPFGLAKRGYRSLYAPAAVAEEKLVPTLEGEFERKRRMMRGLWDIVVTDRMWDLRGYTPTYAFEIVSHRLARYASPLLHALAFAANLLLLRRARIYTLTLSRPDRPARRHRRSRAGGLRRPSPAPAPLLRPSDRLDRARRRRPAADGPARGLGAFGGHPMSTPAERRELTEEEIARAFAEPDNAPPVGSHRPAPGLPRWLDVVIAATVLAVAAPLLALIAILIKLESRGPVFFKQIRVGRYERPFQLYKLRTMAEGSDPIGVGTRIESEDPRITRVGRWLRRFSVDEVPNLINVLRGEMRIVGPRPTIPSQVALFSDRQRRRHDVRPGMTGWAQVNGRVGLEWGERIELDIYYVEHRSRRLDLRILARTVQLVLSGKGLYTGG